MPLYLCNAVRGAIPCAAKAKIAADITDVHCDITGALRASVHVFFFDDAPEKPVEGKRVFLFGTMPAGPISPDTCALGARIKASIFAHTGIPPEEILADTTMLPAGWILQGGTLPEEEDAPPAPHPMV